MEPGNRDRIYTIKDVTEDKSITVQGKNSVHLIGLAQDGGIKAVETEECSAQGICVSLVQLTICKNGGMILVPINRDIGCSINGNVLTSEINLLSGVPIDVADRTIKIYRGNVPKALNRRQLPTTPGTAFKASPPPKPRRGAEDEEAKEKEKADKKDQSSSPPPPVIDPSILSDVESTGQLADLAASFLTKQINQYTDSKLSTVITDQIFSLLQEVVAYQRSIIVTYVTEISQSLEEMPESERDRPMHRPSVKLLIELLRQIMDPLSHVVLNLQLLRTFSHFPQNLDIMVQCQATPAILGCMSVYLDVTEIQQYGLDILAKIATYKPKIEEKLPLRETALEMILRAMKHHCKNMHIVQPGCRTLTNLTGTLQDILDNLLNTEYQFSPEVEEAIEKYEVLLRHIFELSIPIVQNTMEEFPNSLDVKTEGRMFLFSYSKMTQFLQKKKLRAEIAIGPSKETDLTETLTTPGMFRSVPENNEPPGILKKSQFTPLSSTLDRKVHFADEEDPLDSLTSSDTESEFDLTSSLENGPLLVVKETKILSEEDAEALKRGDHESELEGSIDSDYMKMNSSSDIDSPQSPEFRSCNSLVEENHNNSNNLDNSPDEDKNRSEDLCSSPVIGDQNNTKDMSTSPVTGDQNESEDMSSSPVKGDQNDSKNLLNLSVTEDQNKTSDLSNSLGTSDQNDSIDKQNMCDSSKTHEGHSLTTDTVTDSVLSINQLSNNVNDVNSEHVNDLEDSGEEYVEMSLDSSQVSMNSPTDTSEIDGMTEDAVEGEQVTGSPSFFRQRSYTVSDVAIFTKIIRLQVCQFVSSLVFGGDDATALSEIDQPVVKLLSDANAPPGLIKYVEVQYQKDKTLMDIDTSYLISIIDAIRYRSLFHDQLQKLILEVVNCMYGRYSNETLSIAVMCLWSVFKDAKLLSLLAEENYLKEMSGSLYKLSNMLQKDIPEIQELCQFVFEIKPVE